MPANDTKGELAMEPKENKEPNIGMIKEKIPSKGDGVRADTGRESH